MVRTKRTLNSGLGVEYHRMHRIELDQILRDADVAYAVSPIVRRHRLTEAETERVLLELHIPRAANIAGIIYATELSG